MDYYSVQHIVFGRKTHYSNSLTVSSCVLNWFVTTAYRLAASEKYGDMGVLEFADHSEFFVSDRW